MRTPSFVPFVALAASVALAGCGGTTAVSVQGHPLNVVETSFGDPAMGSGYCGALTISGQFEVLITDFPACSQMHAMKDNNTVFHKEQETNLRLIFPSTLTKVPKVNVFNIMPGVNCTTNDNPNASTAAAIFSVDDGLPRQGGVVNLPYDVLTTLATSGTITVTDFTTKSSLAGTYDLTFGSDHITGSFNALYCSGLTPAYGN